MTQISILGTGSVGSALARGLVATGHDVTMGSRDPETATPDLGDAAEVDVEGRRTAARRAGVVVLALPAAVAVDLAGDLSGVLAGKIVVDPTNEYPDPSGPDSIAERIAAAAPDADVVKAFNTIGAEYLANPEIGGEAASMFVAGSNQAARDAVLGLATDLGFDPVDAGGLDAAAHLEGVARAWIHLAGEHGRGIGFRLLRE